jgi:hypothetical protein
VIDRDRRQRSHEPRHVLHVLGLVRHERTSKGTLVPM